jgi:hypothetical protein
VALSTTSASAGTTSPASPYADQVQRAGLSEAQAAALQKKVDGYLARTHGRQTGPNTIAIPGGQATVGVPGERYARDLRTTLQPHTAMSCNYGNFCAVMDADQGTQYDFYYCGGYDVSYLYGPGAWINNQTQSRRVRMHGSSGSTIYTTPNAFSQDPTADWSPVYSLTTCVAAG